MTGQETTSSVHGDGALVAWLLEQQALMLLVATFGGMLLLMMVEQVLPRRPSPDIPVARWLTNWTLAMLNYFLLLWVMVLFLSADWVAALRPEPGVLGALHPVPAFLVLLLVVEATVYGIHRLFHAVPVLWRFHAVHHTDTEVDVTTSHRHHFFEVMVVALSLGAFHILLGAQAELLFLLALFRLVVVLVSHSNLYLPETVDHWLRLLLVTPDFHRLHHSSQRRFTDSNFGAVLPWFDYLFGTARRVPFGVQLSMQTGLEYLREPRDSRIDRLLLLPWVWPRPRADGTR